LTAFLAFLLPLLLLPSSLPAATLVDLPSTYSTTNGPLSSFFFILILLSNRFNRSFDFNESPRSCSCSSSATRPLPSLSTLARLRRRFSDSLAGSVVVVYFSCGRSRRERVGGWVRSVSPREAKKGKENDELTSSSSFFRASSPSTQQDLEAWARLQYLEALCMPEVSFFVPFHPRKFLSSSRLPSVASSDPQTIYPLAHIIPTLQRLSLPPLTTTTSLPSPSPLLPLLLPLPLLSQKYRRRLPPLLPSLLHASASSSSSSLEGIDEKEWKALRTGLSIWMGSKAPPSASSRGGYQRDGEVENEEQAGERVRLELLKEEERKLAEGKRWLEGLERRE